MIKLTIATAALVFFRGLQQQNVIHGHYIAAAVTPFAIAAGEVATVLWVVQANTFAAVPWIGIGGAIGVTASMWAHRRLNAKSDR